MLYSRLGVEEFITYDPDANLLSVFIRTAPGTLQEVEEASTEGWVSPRMGIRFAPNPRLLDVYDRDGRPLRFYGELVEDVRTAGRLQAEAEAECAKAEAERARVETYAAALEAKLRALGVEPE